MGLRIVHISDTHGKHENLTIPECDVLVFTGDMGTRTNELELVSFLSWIEKQPADVKIVIAGNHDICMDKNWVKKQKNEGSVEGILAQQHYQNAKVLMESYKVKYLEDKDYVYNGIKFYGSPYSPSFHRERWVFNADRGEEIKKVWSKIPSDVNILLTHTPPYKILDYVDGRYKRHPDEDQNVGCEDLMSIIKTRLTKLKLHCFGHIHETTGILIKDVSQTRRVIFSNGACVTNNYQQVVTKPFIIEI